MPRTKEERQQWQAQGLCYNCAKPRGESGTRSHCRRCADNTKRRQAKYRNSKGNPKVKYFIKDGRCLRCHQAPNEHEDQRVCESCYFRQLAYTHLGARNRWTELKTLWEQQRGICPYTGLQLEFGVDASVDHILPSSRFPEHKRDISNLEWVHESINRMKKDWTKEEFLDFLQMVSFTVFKPQEEESPWAASQGGEEQGSSSPPSRT